MKVKAKKSDCPICKKKTIFFYEKKKEPIDYYPKNKKIRTRFKNLRLFFFKNCNHISQQPKPSKKLIDEFYLNSNQSELNTNIQIISLRENKKIQRIVNTLKNYSFKNKKILDLGI